MAENFKKQLSKLSKRGPHRVLVGDLSYAGIPGKVYTPAEGNGIPGIAFGHDWMTPVKRYHHTLKHLASWGIAVAAPDTETGFMPNHQGFSSDLETALQIVAGVKLGTGNVTVSPVKLGIAGHGMGAGAAVLAAAGRDSIHAVGALYPAATAPSCVDAARHVKTPGLIVASGKEDLLDSLESNLPVNLAANWGGALVYRELKKGTQQGFSEGILIKAAIGLGLPEFSAQELARGLLTGFLLNQLDNNKKYSAFSQEDVQARNLTSLSKDQVLERTQATDGILSKLLG